jgi:hypothetical protein
VRNEFAKRCRGRKVRVDERVRASTTGAFEISWQTYDGSLEVETNGSDVWAMMGAEGLWYPERGYQGYAVEAMQHGLDRVANFVAAHPEMLNSADSHQS